jgi:adenine-specific DNA-methyltransferase
MLLMRHAHNTSPPAADDGGRPQEFCVSESDNSSANNHNSANGFVTTPETVADLMVEKLFSGKPPSPDATLLDPGCGPGALIQGVIRWCERNVVRVPSIVGVEIDRSRAAEARAKFVSYPSVKIVKGNFLGGFRGRFDYILGNPPYVSITRISEGDKAKYRRRFKAASGRFDLYMLFFEQGLKLLKSCGRLVFITPEKFLYVKSAEPLRRMLGGLNVQELHLVGEETFGGLVTYPIITTADNAPAAGPTTIVLRDYRSRQVRFPTDGSSLLPLLHGYGDGKSHGPTLRDICARISCGVATGADEVFVCRTKTLDKRLWRFAYPTIAGRQLPPGQAHVDYAESLLIPYSRNGKLVRESELGRLGAILSEPRSLRKLKARACAKRKPWYAFHDSVPLDEILRPKLLCKDIAAEPRFWFDREGTIVPRHSVYYIVPKDPSKLDEIAVYLGSPEAVAWLRANCQRAANGFIRLQSAALKRLPIPVSMITAPSEPAVRESRRPAR